MKRFHEDEDDVADALKHENWRLGTPQCPVKIVPLQWPIGRAVGGYFTVEKYLIGMTPVEMETQLGLPTDFLRWGVRIHRFLRIPSYSEYTFELSLKYPGGLAFSETMSDPDYRPGSDHILQWCLLPGIKVTIDPTASIAVRPGNRFRS